MCLEMCQADMRMLLCCFVVVCKQTSFFHFLLCQEIKINKKAWNTILANTTNQLSNRVEMDLQRQISARDDQGPVLIISCSAISILFGALRNTDGKVTKQI